MHEHEPARDGQAEPGPASPDARLAHLPVLLEDRRALGRANPGPGVAHARDGAASVALQGDDDLPALGELDGIAHQVLEDAADAPCVRVGRDLRLALRA